jgi:hypothetical protein
MEKIQCDKCGMDNFNTSKYCCACGYELPKVVTETVPDTPVKSKHKYTVAQIVGSVIGTLVTAGMFMFVSKCFSPTFDKALVEMANEFNKTLPLMIDSETRVDNVMPLPDKTILYTYTLISYDKETIDTLVIKSNLEPYMINNIKTSPEMKFLRDNKITFRYFYRDKNGNYLFSMQIKPDQYND